MVFQRDNIPIGKALRVRNLYVLDIVRTRVSLAVRGRAIYKRSQTPKLDLYHQRLAHAGLVQIKQASKITTGLEIEDNTPTDPITLPTPNNKQPGNVSDTGMSDLTTDILYKSVPEVCEPYVASKQTRVVHHEPMKPTTKKLKQVHLDL